MRRQKFTGAKHHPGLTEEAWRAAASKAIVTHGLGRGSENEVRRAMKESEAGRHTRGFKPTGPSRRK